MTEPAASAGRKPGIDRAIDALDALRPAEAAEAAGECRWWDEIAEIAVNAAIDNGQVIESGDEVDLDADRMLDLLADGDCAGAADLLREAFPLLRPLAAQRRINEARRALPA